MLVASTTQRQVFRTGTVSVYHNSSQTCDIGNTIRHLGSSVIAAKPCYGDWKRIGSLTPQVAGLIISCMVPIRNIVNYLLP